MADPEKFGEQSQLGNSQQLIAVYRALLYLLSCKLLITFSQSMGLIVRKGIMQRKRRLNCITSLYQKQFNFGNGICVANVDPSSIIALTVDKQMLPKKNLRLC